MIGAVFPNSKRLAKAALAAGMMAGAGLGAMVASSPAMAAAPAAAPKADYTKEFIAVAGPLQAELDKAKKAAPDAAAIAVLKSKAEAIPGVVKSGDDKLLGGNMLISVGGYAKDTAMQVKGVNLMLESGKADAKLTSQLHYYAGQFAYEGGDYAKTRSELQASIDAGNKDPEVEVLIAEAFFKEKNEKDGLVHLQKAIAGAKAAGTPIADGWYRRALGAAYNAKQFDAAVDVGVGLVSSSPTKDNWNAAIAVVRDMASLPSQDTLDLLRLMGHTNSFLEERDYIEYVQDADPKRNPGEVKAIIDKGVAAGQVNASKEFFAEALRIANGKLAGDKATLPGLDRDARLPTAKASLATGAGDAFLSYGQGAKAAELYKIALDKPGVDKPLALTRLGIALVDAGDFAGAIDAFGKVDGPRKPFAQLWTAYAKQKQAGK